LSLAELHNYFFVLYSDVYVLMSSQDPTQGCRADDDDDDDDDDVDDNGGVVLMSGLMLHHLFQAL